MQYNSAVRSNKFDVHSERIAISKEKGEKVRNRMLFIAQQHFSGDTQNIFFPQSKIHIWNTWTWAAIETEKRVKFKNEGGPVVVHSGGPVVESLPSNAGDSGLIPGCGAAKPGGPNGRVQVLQLRLDTANKIVFFFLKWRRKKIKHTLFCWLRKMYYERTWWTQHSKLRSKERKSWVYSFSGAAITKFHKLGG